MAEIDLRSLSDKRSDIEDLIAELKEIALEKFEHENRPNGMSLLLEDAAETLEFLLEGIDNKRFIGNHQ